MRATLYARFSTDKQSENSIDDQFRVCERIADREGFAIVSRFNDAAISGGTAQRPGYQSMLSAARRREFDVIVAEDSSRLWRELSEQWRTLKELQDLGVHVVGHGLDTRREESKILLAVSGAMAEAYRDEIARRTHRGLEGRARAGAPTGGKAFGYTAARDSATGRMEIDEPAAAIVRRIFTMYADGSSPRTIAATLNAEGVSSPGAKWNRIERRRDGKWLASTIHGDVNRGTGILNNRRYAGIVLWGRSKWTRGAADSSQRSMKMNVKALHEAQDERLRIVPQDLWDRVKTRQRRYSVGADAKISGTSRRRAPGAGRPARHLLSGLLRCGICEAGFTISNGERYQCASHMNGRACTNTISVRKSIAEARILGQVKADLLDPTNVTDIETRVQRLLNAQKPTDGRARISELTRQIEKMTEAIAAGLVSSALAQRLAAAEAELAKLQVARPVSVARIAPRVTERVKELVGRLEAAGSLDRDKARAALREILGEVRLIPDPSGRFLWAEYGLEINALTAMAVGSDLMVAGAGFANYRRRVSLRGGYWTGPRTPRRAVPAQ